MPAGARDVVSARARARGDSGACAVSGVAIGVRGPPVRRVGWERSDFREDPLRAHCCWRRGSETKVAPDRILNQFNKIIQVDFKSFLQLI